MADFKGPIWIKYLKKGFAQKNTSKDVEDFKRLPIHWKHYWPFYTYKPLKGPWDVDDKKSNFWRQKTFKGVPKKIKISKSWKFLSYRPQNVRWTKWLPKGLPYENVFTKKTWKRRVPQKIFCINIILIVLHTWYTSKDPLYIDVSKFSSFLYKTVVDKLENIVIQTPKLVYTSSGKIDRHSPKLSRTCFMSYPYKLQNVIFPAPKRCHTIFKSWWYLL